MAHIQGTLHGGRLPSPPREVRNHPLQRMCLFLFVGNVLILLFHLFSDISRPDYQTPYFALAARISTRVLHQDSRTQEKTQGRTVVDDLHQTASQSLLTSGWNVHSHGYRENAKTELLRGVLSDGGSDVHERVLPVSNQSSYKHFSAARAVPAAGHLLISGTSTDWKDPDSQTSQAHATSVFVYHSPPGESDSSLPAEDTVSPVFAQVTVAYDPRWFPDTSMETLTSLPELTAETQRGIESTTKDHHDDVIETLAQEASRGRTLGDKRNSADVERDSSNSITHTASRAALDSKGNPSISLELSRRGQGLSMTAETTADQDLGNRQPQRAEEPKPSRRGQIPGEDKPTIEGSPQRIWTSESPGFETTKSPLSTWNEQQGAFGVADSDIAAATAEALKKLLTRVKEQQASLGEEWRRYEELEYRRMRLLSAGGRNMGLADTHREGLREANAEFHRSLAYLQQTVDTLQKQMDTLSLGRLASRAALLGSADSPGWRSGDGRNSSEQSQPSFKDRLGRAQKNAGDARGHSTWAKQDRSEGRTSSTDLVFVQPTELLVVATRVHELLGHQQRLTDFLGSLVSLQSHRLLQQEWPLESQIRELQENNVSASVLPSRIRKARPQRVQWRTYRHAKYAAASRAEEARMTASVFGSFPGDNAFFGGRIGMNHHFHEVPVQPTSPQSVSVLGKPPRTVHGSSSASVQTKKEERPKGRRGVVGGFEVFDDPEETVTAALQRFLYPAYSLAFVANLVPGSGGRRTQGVGGLAEATVHGRMEWLTDSTVFADRKLNEIVEEKMTKRAARSGLPTTRFVPTAPGRDRPWNRNDATTETPVPAVLDAVRYAEKAASLTAFYDRVEQEGAEEAQKKPDVGTPQDIIFQYAFDNVPLEHKRALWKDYLQVQLEDRGYDILLPDESTEGQRNDDDTRRLAPDVGVLPPGMHSSVVENAADGPETSQFSQQPPVNPAVELSWLVEDAFGHADRRSSSTPTGLFQGLMDANLAREAQARSGNNALKLEIPTLNTKEWGALEYSGDTGNIIPFLKDDLVSRELLQEILLVQGGVGGEEGAVLGLDSWAFEESTENSDTDLLHDEDFDNNENLGWAWDFVL